jgi:hypothetical protein
LDSPQQEQSGIQHNVFLYAQDDWRATRRLTLNLGLRYELPLPWYQPQNYWGTLIPGRQSTVIPTAPVGMLFPGDTGVPRGLVQTPMKDFAPRVGLSYDLFGNGKTAIRAGFGIFYDSVDANIIQNNSQPFVYAYTFAGPLSFSNPLAGQAAIPTTVNVTNPTFVGTQQIFYPDPNLKTPYVEAFNLGVQQQLMRNLSLEIDYVGKLGRREFVPFSSNPAICPAGTTCSTATTNARRILQGFGNNTEYSSSGSSNYNALEVQITRRFASWLGAQGAYTYARSFDTFSGNTETAAAPDVFNLATSEYGPSSFNPTQVGSLGYTVYAPKLHRFNPYVRAILSDWNLSGIYSIQSGLPLNITLGNLDNAFSSTPNQRPNVSGSFQLPSDRDRVTKEAEWFNTSVFSLPAPGTFGNLGRDAVIGPAKITNNASIARSFPIPLRESMKLQFRCDAFGLFNTPNLGNPNTTFSTSKTSTFGQITSTSGNRSLQLSLHLFF